MKTQNAKHKLVFSKSSITELTDSQSNTIKGGCQWSHSSGPTLSIIKIPTQYEEAIV